MGRLNAYLREEYHQLQVNHNSIHSITKDFIIEKQIAHNFFVIHQIYQTPLPSYATQIINPFLNSMVLANHEIGLEFQLIVKSL